MWTILNYWAPGRFFFLPWQKLQSYWILLSLKGQQILYGQLLIFYPYCCTRLDPRYWMQSQDQIHYLKKIKDRIWSWFVQLTMGLDTRYLIYLDHSFGGTRIIIPWTRLKTVLLNWIHTADHVLIRDNKFDEIIWLSLAEWTRIIIFHIADLAP